MSDLTPEDLTVQEMERFLDFCGERIFARSQGVASDAQRFLAAIRAGKIPGLVWHRPGSLASSREMDADALRARVAELTHETTRLAERVKRQSDELCVARVDLSAAAARVAELEAQAKGHADECDVGLKLRDSVAAELGLTMDTTKALRAHVARLETAAMDRHEAVVIAHGVGAASRNGEVRTLRAGLDDAYGSMAAQDEREKVAGEMCGVMYHLHGCDWPDAVAERVVALEAQAKHQSVNLAQSLAAVNACAIAKTLLADAQICVREVIEENAANWGDRLMHKQQPAIDCDAAITAFLEGK